MSCLSSTHCDLPLACSCLSLLPFRSCYPRCWAAYAHSVSGMSDDDLCKATCAITSAFWHLQDVPVNSVTSRTSIEWIFGDGFYVRGYIGAFIAHDKTTAIYSAVLTNMLCNDTRVYFAPRSHVVRVPLSAANETDLCHAPCNCGESNPDVGEIIMKIFAAQATRGVEAFVAPAQIQNRFDTAMAIAPPPMEFSLHFETRDAKEMHIIEDDPQWVGNPIVPESTLVLPSRRCGLPPGVIVTECCEECVIEGNGVTGGDAGGDAGGEWRPVYEDSLTYNDELGEN